MSTDWQSRAVDLAIAVAAWLLLILGGAHGENVTQAGTGRLVEKWAAPTRRSVDARRAAWEQSIPVLDNTVEISKVLSSTDASDSLAFVE